MQPHDPPGTLAHSVVGRDEMSRVSTQSPFAALALPPLFGCHSLRRSENMNLVFIHRLCIIKKSNNKDIATYMHGLTRDATLEHLGKGSHRRAGFSQSACMARG